MEGGGGGWAGCPRKQRALPRVAWWCVGADRTITHTYKIQLAYMIRSFVNPTRLACSALRVAGLPPTSLAALPTGACPEPTSFLHAHARPAARQQPRGSRFVGAAAAPGRRQWRRRTGSTRQDTSRNLCALKLVLAVH